jgi:hypothetical protein
MPEDHLLVVSSLEHSCRAVVPVVAATASLSPIFFPAQRAVQVAVAVVTVAVAGVAAVVHPSV